MAEYHRKIEGLCYKAQSSSGIPNILLLEYLKIAGMKREYEAEASKYVYRNAVIWSESFDWTFCAEHSEADND